MRLFFLYYIRWIHNDRARPNQVNQGHEIPTAIRREAALPELYPPVVIS